MMPPLTLKDRLVALIGADGLVLGRVAGQVQGVSAGGGGPHAANHENSGSDEISVAGLSGLLADPQTPAAHTHSIADLTDDGALAAKSTVATADIDNDAVTYAKMQNVSGADKLLGRSTAGAGDAEEIPCTAAGRAILDDADAAAQRTTLGAEAAGAAASAVASHEAAADPHTGYQKESEKAAANGYASLGADGLVPSAQLPASGAGFMVGVKKDADQTGIGTSATDVTGLSVAVTSGQRIRFRAFLLVRTSATNIGGMTSVNGPAASPVSFERFEWTSATVRATGTMATALDAFTARTAGPGATTVLYEIYGFAKFSANGTFIVRAKAESGGTMSVLEGSWMEYNLA